ncbi:hypothetical protein AB0E08_46345 [Streptomyces sp. NPDC048281]|uniref:hypothetical protein n=1 Tax=Streptomyces sp. NPDC048281 TaxID=3154715 RepID=UPI003433808D
MERALRAFAGFLGQSRLDLPQAHAERKIRSEIAAEHPQLHGIETAGRRAVQQ